MEAFLFPLAFSEVPLTQQRQFAFLPASAHLHFEEEPKMSESRKIQQIYVLSTSLQQFSVGWFFSTYVLFLLGNGLTLFHVNLLNVGFMTANFFLDPPTGFLADRIGQKRV